MIDRKYGPWALIVGASEGLGVSYARQVAESGINLVLVARKEGPLAEVAQQVRTDFGVETRTLSLDLTRDDMLDRIREVTDDLDIGLLIYNAGAAHRLGPFLDQPLEDAMKVVLLNPVGQVTLSHHFGRRFVARKSGGIILMGSGVAVAGALGVVTYSASKIFSQYFAEGLWAEVKDKGVDVVQVPLGSFSTPSMERIGLGHGSKEWDQQVRDILDNITNGPVYIPPSLAEMFRSYAAMSRREAAEIHSERIGRLPGMKG